MILGKGYACGSQMTSWSSLLPPYLGSQLGPRPPDSSGKHLYRLNHLSRMLNFIEAALDPFVPWVNHSGFALLLLFSRERWKDEVLGSNGSLYQDPETGNWH